MHDYEENFELDLDKTSTQFHVAATDAGLCQVLNGNTMKSTYASTIRMEELWKALDQRDETVPKTIG